MRRRSSKRNESLMHFVLTQLVYFDRHHRRLRFFRVQHCAIFLHAWRMLLKNFLRFADRFERRNWKPVARPAD